MSKTIEEIKQDVINLIVNCPGITEREIAKKLKLSKRYATKLFDDMISRGEICQN